jgi:hypothetical protein
MSEMMIETESNEPKVYQIPVENMPALNEKLAKLNKRAEKLGCEPIVLTVTGEKMVEVTDHTNLDEDRLRCARSRQRWTSHSTSGQRQRP